MKIIKLEKVLALGFEAAVLIPIRGAHSIAGDSIWSPLKRFTEVASRTAGKISRGVFPGKDREPLIRAMSFIDWAEALVGVYGEWEIVDEKSAFKRVRSCQFAQKWGGADKFCTILGEAMGNEAISAIYPDREIKMEIRSALSQGAPYCEYYLKVE